MKGASRMKNFVLKKDTSFFCVTIGIKINKNRYLIDLISLHRRLKDNFKIFWYVKNEV